MASLKTLIEDVKDPESYDGVLFLGMKDGTLANIGYSGKLPQGIDSRVFTYRLLQEAGFAVAFTQNKEDIK